TVGDGGAVLTSTNGTSWQPEDAGATNYLTTASGAIDTRLAAGELEVRLRQTNLWQNELSATSASRPPFCTYLSSFWDGRLFLLGGRSGMIVEGFQTNLAAPYVWVTRNDSIRNWLWHLTRAPNFYIAVGDLGTVMTSEDGIDWS